MISDEKLVRKLSTQIPYKELKENRIKQACNFNQTQNDIIDKLLDMDDIVLNQLGPEVTEQVFSEDQMDNTQI